MINKTIVSSTVNIEIPFFDVDPMGIVWHGNYMKYLEIARCSLLEKINYTYVDMKSSGYAWPIVDIRIKYIKPTTFRQHISVETRLVEYENRLKIEYLIKDKLTQEKLTTGYSIQVAICLKTNEMCFVSPDVLLKKLEKYL
jgi:acyl-CoA thioester hydrolase